MAFYDSIKLEKGMYNICGKNFTNVLEELDPSENYEGCDLAGLDAYERQLKRFDIKVSGYGSDTVDKFFRSTNSAVLFPEYVVRAVKQGMESADMLSSVVSTKTLIDNLDYRPITSTPEETTGVMPNINELSNLPSITVKTQDNLIKMHKRGRMIVSSYEAMRYQHLDVFTVILKQIGAQIARSHLKDALDVVINGDGNENAAPTSKTISTNSFTYADLIKIWTELAPYEFNTLFANASMMQTLMGFSEMKDSQAGLDFHGTGRIITPLGATLIYSPDVAAKTVVALDRTCAIEMVQAGDIIIDYDKLIDRQLEKASICSIAGFAKIFNKANLVMSYT